MPAVFLFANSQAINYIYTSDGRKIASAIDGSFTYYRNTLVYEGASNIPTKIFHPEGFVDFTTDTYKYFKKDHLGNVRVLLAVDGYSYDEQQALIAEQNTDYYPFGLAHGQYENLHLNRFLFSGKELQDAPVGTHGMLGWYDFGFRQYNPLLGHWMTPDPLARNFAEISPYAYCLNNPVNYIDRWGLQPQARLKDTSDPETKTAGDIKAVEVWGVPSISEVSSPYTSTIYFSWGYTFGLAWEIGGSIWSQILKQVKDFNEFIKKLNTPGEVLNAIEKLDPSLNKNLVKFSRISNKVSNASYGIETGILINDMVNGTASKKQFLDFGLSTLGQFGGAYGIFTAITIQLSVDSGIWLIDYIIQSADLFQNRIKNQCIGIY